MSRKTFNPDEDVLLPPHGAMPVETRLPCRRCDTPTSTKDLNTYGARCYSCFQAYCREPQPPQKLFASPARQQRLDEGDDA